MRTNLFYIVFSVLFLTIGTNAVFGQDKSIKSQEIPAKKLTRKEKKEAEKQKVITKPIVVKKTDTIKLDTLNKGKSVLEGQVKYKAKYYAKFDQKKQLLTLYDEAELYYQDYILKAGIIVYDYKKNEVYAGRLKDSTGAYTQIPYFKQGSNVVEPDSIRFNYKTKKALIWNSRTTQQEMNIIAEKSKKVSDSVYFMKRAKITTSQDLEDPEYYILASKMKMVPGKKVVVGVSNFWFYGVPTPIAMPFAFLPITQKSHSGILMPTWSQSATKGYSIQNGGYYFALSDKYDLALTGDYYTNGSYALRADSKYAKKYKFSGNVNIRFENQIASERGYPDYSKTKIYNIQWSHAKDGKSNPNSRFSASVNMGSSKYFQNSLSVANMGAKINNNLSSSISYSKTLNTIPAISFTLATTHSQNTQTQSIAMSLPTLQASVDRIYPFVGKNGVKKGFIKNINLQYNLQGKNQIQTVDSLFMKKAMFSNATTGFQHSIPLSTNFKLLKYFSATSSANYNEIWTLNTINKSKNLTTDKDVVTRVNGFDSYRTYSFSNSIGTTIYGTFNFGKNSRIQSIRHVMRPSVSHSYAPGFNQYYTQYATNAIGTTYNSYSRFETTAFGAPGQTMSNSLGFSLSNTFEAKVKDRDSTKTELKKIMLLNNLNFGAGYNLQTQKWSTINFSGGTTLFKKMNVNFGGNIDPYAYTTTNFYRSPFSISSANLSMGYSVTSKDFENEKKDKQNQQNGGRNDDLFGTSDDLTESQKEDKNQKKEVDTFSGFYSSKLPWDMTLAYTMSYTNTSNTSKIGSASLMISANTDLTPKWKIGFSTSYDFVGKGVGVTQIRMNRDLLSWNMSFNWAPFGNNPYWGFFIGIKSGMLKDIKWDKHSTYK